MRSRRPSRIAAALTAAGLACLAGAATAATGAGAASSAAWTFAGAPRADVRSIAVDPKDPGTVYAAARDDGVWISRDAGHTWDASNKGLDHIAAWAVSVDASKTNVVWLATEVGGAYRSVNHGRTWKQETSGATDTLADYDLRIPPVESSTELLLPLLSTADVVVGSRDRNQGHLLQDLDPDKANRGGVWGYVIDQCMAESKQPTAPGGCAVRADWPPEGFDYRDPDVDPDRPGDQPGAPYPRTLIHFQFASDIVAVPGGALMTAFRGSGNRLGGGFFTTSDDGRTWTMALRDAGGNRLVEQNRAANIGANLWRVRAAPSDPKVVYLGGTGGVWRSADGGVTWRGDGPAGHGGTVASVDGGFEADTRGLVVDPRDPDLVYAGTWGAGVRVSSDGGQTWEDSSSGLPEESGVWSLSFDPLDPKRMLAAVYWYGVFESRDAGASWRAVNAGFDADGLRQVYTVVASPDGTLYAGTIDGVWRLGGPAVRGTKTKRPAERPLPATGLRDTALFAAGLALLGAAALIGRRARSLRR